VTVRAATDDDFALLTELWQAFEREVPPPRHHDLDPEKELAEIREIVAAGLAFLAEDDHEVVGFALARRIGSRSGRLSDLYVVPAARRRGVASALVGAVVEALAPEGVEHLELEVLSSNTAARSVYHRWGFAEDQVILVAPTSELRERLTPGRHAESFASLHVQTDAVVDVERAVRDFAPRIGSRGSRTSARCSPVSCARRASQSCRRRSQAARRSWFAQAQNRSSASPFAAAHWRGVWWTWTMSSTSQRMASPPDSACGARSMTSTTSRSSR